MVPPSSSLLVADPGTAAAAPNILHPSSFALFNLLGLEVELTVICIHILSIKQLRASSMCKILTSPSSDWRRRKSFFPVRLLPLWKRRKIVLMITSL
jgi:hypothetical protein